jgi:hypothetical protein
MKLDGIDLKDNPLNLTPITNNELFIDPDNVDTAYVYANDESNTFMIHLRGKNITKKLPIGSLVEIVYMEPNHLFLLLVSSKKNKYTYTVSRLSDKDYDKYHTSIKVNKLAKDLKFKPQDPKQSNARHSGVTNDIIPYKCYNALGWLFNIEDFQPTY